MALHQRKGFTAKQARRTSVNVHDNMVGTHVRKQPTMRKHQHMNADHVAFSNVRRQNRAVKGEVNTVYPGSGGSHAAGHARVGHRGPLQDRVKKERARSIVRAIAIIAIVAVIAVGAGIFTYNFTTNNETALSNSDAKSALTTVKDASSPFYALISVELGANNQTAENGGPDVLLLTRVDAANREVTFVPIPDDLQVTVSGTTTQIAKTAQSGDAALINAVANFANIKIAHYFKLSQQNLVDLVNALGGVEVTLAQEIDDPNAGDIYIPSGTQTLDGAAAVVYQRATNVSDGVDGRLANQAHFASALLGTVLSGSGSSDFTALLDKIAPDFQTDMATGDLSKLCSSLKGMTADDFTVVTVPGYETSTTAVGGGTTTYYQANSSSWTTTMEQLDAGNTAAGQSTVGTVDPSSFTVTVENGASITGAASSTASLLTSKGFKVEKTGNTDQAVYEETLVIYDGENGAAQAQTVIDAIGMGRAVKGQGYYDYDTDVLLILGGDYKPTS